MVVYRANMETAPGYPMHCNRHRRPGIEFENVTVNPQMHGKMLLPHRDTQNRKMEHTEDRHTNSVCEVTWDANMGLKNQRNKMYMAGKKKTDF